MNHTNLKLLADYLWTLPDDYELFNMDTFNETFSRPMLAARSGSCGTSACAVGHAPNVKGIPLPYQVEDWSDYSTRIFDLDWGEDHRGWDWCFSDNWTDADNTPKGAAKRIYYLLKVGEEGLPPFSYEEEDCEVYQYMEPNCG